MTENHDFWGYLSTFEVENTPKKVGLLVENQCLKTSKTTSKKLWKIQKKTFFISEMVKNDP